MSKPLITVITAISVPFRSIALVSKYEDPDFNVLIWSNDFSFGKHFYRYGDRYPISVPGRLLAICIILTGIIINALFISATTSSLTVFVSDETANPERGSKVSSLISDFRTHPKEHNNQAGDSSVPSRKTQI